MTDSTPTFYEYIFRSTADGILISDSHDEIVAVNPAAAAMLRETVEELIGRNPASAFKKYPALVNLFTRSGDQILDVRLPARRLAAGIATTAADGSRLVMLQDVTEQRDLDSRRQALVNTVAHDLRNPIAALSGYAELVEKFGDLNENQRRFNQRIQQTAGKIYEVAAALVDLAWVEAGLPQAHVPIQLSDTIRSVIDSLSGLARSHQVGIAFSVQAPMPPI